jgi:hypothetical protein
MGNISKEERQRRKDLERESSKPDIEIDTNGETDTPDIDTEPSFFENPLPDNPAHEQIEDDKNPLLNQPVVEADYTKSHAQITGQIPSEIPEPVIQPPIIDFNNATPLDENPLEGPEPVEPKPDRGKITNPAMDDASRKEKTAAVGYLVDTFINIYKQLNKLGLDICTMTREKMQKLAMEGKFDMRVLDLRIPVTESESISVGQFVDDVNEELKKIMVVKEETETEARSLLTIICKDRGWGLTPVQRLIALGVEDSIPKITAIISIRSQFNQIFKMGMRTIQNDIEYTQTKPNPGAPVTNPETRETSEAEFVPTEEVTGPSMPRDHSGNLKEPE